MQALSSAARGMLSSLVGAPLSEQRALTQRHLETMLASAKVMHSPQVRPCIRVILHPPEQGGECGTQGTTRGSRAHTGCSFQERRRVERSPYCELRVLCNR